MLSNSLPDPSQPHAKFLLLLANSLEQNRFVKLLLGQYAGTETALQRVLIRAVAVREQACRSFVYRYQTQDITKNLPVAEGLILIRELIEKTFRHAHLLTTNQDIQFSINKKSSCNLRIGKTTHSVIHATITTAKSTALLIFPSPF